MSPALEWKLSTPASTLGPNSSRPRSSPQQPQPIEGRSEGYPQIVESIRVTGQSHFPHPGQRLMAAKSMSSSLGERVWEEETETYGCCVGSRLLACRDIRRLLTIFGLLPLVRLTAALLEGRFFFFGRASSACKVGLHARTDARTILRARVRTAYRSSSSVSSSASSSVSFSSSSPDDMTSR